MFFESSPLTSYGIGSENFTSERYFLKVPTRASLLAMDKSEHKACVKFKAEGTGLT